MSHGYDRLTDFLKDLSQDSDLQATRERVRSAIENANIDPNVKQAMLDGDVDKVHATLARESAEAEQFVLFFL
jgi:hypothetical protein